MKRHVYVFLNTEAETRAQAVDETKLIVALSHAVKSSDMRAILEGVTSEDQQWFHDLTLLPKKCISYCARGSSDHKLSSMSLADNAPSKRCLSVPSFFTLKDDEDCPPRKNKGWKLLSSIAFPVDMSIKLTTADKAILAIERDWLLPCPKGGDCVVAPLF